MRINMKIYKLWMSLLYSKTQFLKLFKVFATVENFLIKNFVGKHKIYDFTYAQ